MKQPQSSLRIDHRDLRLGIISNPNSGRNRRCIGAISGMIGQRSDVRHIVTSSTEQLRTALAELAREGVNLVAVNGGDGSIAHVLTALHVDSPFVSPPLLCALPGGTTNVTVNDVGIRGDLERAVLSLLAWTQQGHRDAQILERPVIRVSSRDDTTLGCGLVFGVGAVVDGIEFWQQQVRARGMRSEFSSGVAMMRTLWGMLRGHRGFARALHMRVRHPETNVAQDGEFMLLVICALQRLFLGIHPFWGSSAGALHFTAIEQGASGFTRALPSILRGRPGTAVSPAAGYHSTKIDRVELQFSGSYTLDGELHRVNERDAPITVSSAGTARFLRI